MGHLQSNPKVIDGDNEDRDNRMATYLLTWNPSRFHWDDIEHEAKQLKGGRVVALQWSCGNNRHIEAGDRVFMLKQGRESRGLIASGWVTKGSFKDQHWKDEAGRGSQRAWYVTFEADVLSSTPLIPRSLLDGEPFNEVYWNTQLQAFRSTPQSLEH